MKRTVALFVVVLMFLATVPAIIAPHPELYEADKVDTQKLEATTIEAKTTTLTAEQKARLEQAQERYQTAKEDYMAARERYEQAKQDYESTKTQLTRVRTQVKDCGSDDTATCDAIRAEYRSKAKDHLENTADRIIEALEKIKAKAEENNNTELVAKLEAKIAEVKSAKETVGELDENSDEEDLQEAVKTIKTSAVQAQKTAKVAAGKVVVVKLRNAYNKERNIQKRMQHKLEVMQEQGLDTTEFENALGQVDTHLDNARDMYLETKDAYDNAENKAEFNRLASAADSKVRQIHQELKLAHQALRKAYVAARQAAGSDDVDLSDEVEDEADDDDEIDEDDDVDEIECTTDDDCDSDETCVESECEDSDEDNSTTGDQQ
ncbi:hypothetical protein GOV04_00165 [Candidatus Woesearchaeota archaeon]|nr:hypothetical protein [Candidatus Woesearchaeota archaeon]